MKQVLQSLKNGETSVVDIPCPQLKAGHVLIQTSNSLISTGTEKMLVEFGKASLLAKARQQPDKVRMVLDKIKTDGIFATLNTVRNKLDQQIPMGYCNVGKVIAVAPDIHDFAVGDRVVSNGPHAEIVVVPKNLCCKVPATISDEEAVFTVAGAIALQGIRLATPTLGETFTVIGLGLIGLLTVQLLRAQGCRVLGVDFDTQRTSLAAQLGAEIVNLSEQDPVTVAQYFSRGRGVDGVLITASTQSNDPIHQAAQMCRQRGRIILIGVTGLELSRAEFYKKELSFQVSCSYGPGRYDKQYEELGHDYPIGFVRWTEQRNFEAFLDMLALKIMNVNPLISARYAISDAKNAYDSLSIHLAILLTYNQTTTPLQQTISIKTPLITKTDKITLGVIGAGNYASKVLIPVFANTGVKLQSIACSSGISGTQHGKKYNFREVTTDVKAIFANTAINIVIIASRHDTHADFICEALRNNKHVFVEKPLCISLKELENITQQLQQTSQLLMIGFNRRFAPHVQKIKSLLLHEKEPKAFIMNINAGDIPPSHWTQDMKIGGGRIIGEACHFIDLLRYLAGTSIVSFNINRMAKITNTNDVLDISLNFADGSIGTIHYLANGHRSYPKERLEIFVAGKVLQLNNFRQLKGYGWSNFKKMNLFRQDKGQNNCVNHFINAVRHALPSPIPIEEIIEVSKVTLEIAMV